MADFFDIKQDRQYEFKPFVVPKYQITFKNVKRLANLTQYVWFTPAPVYLWGRYTDVNLGDIVSEHNIKLFWYKFNKSIFKGLDFQGDPSWNHVLWAVDNTSWNKLADGILESVQFKLDTRVLYRYALQDFVVVDPLQADTQGIIAGNLDLLKVYAFCPITNQRQIAFNPGRKSTMELPTIISLPPRKHSIYMATRLFANPQLKEDNAFDLYKKLLESDADSMFSNKVEKIRKQHARISNT